MAADTLSLRERIGRTLENAWGWFSLLPPHIAYPKLEAVICADLEPWVEQAIQQAREDVPESIAGALSIIRTTEARAERAESALAEKDAQIAALQALVPQIHESLTNDTLYEHPDHMEGSDGPCECEDCGRLRIDVLLKLYARLRETPAPPQEPTKFRTAEARKGDK